MKYLAQLDFGELKGFGPLGNPEGSGINLFSRFISTTIGLMTIVAIIWLAFVLISGALGVMGAGGDKQAMESARKRITSGLIGLVVVIAALFILDLVGTIFGIPNILNIGELFEQITQ